MNEYFQVQVCSPNTLWNLSKLGLSYPGQDYEPCISAPLLPLSLLFLFTPGLFCRQSSCFCACLYFNCVVLLVSQLIPFLALTLILPVLPNHGGNHAQHMAAHPPPPTAWEAHSLSCKEPAHGSCPSATPLWFLPAQFLFTVPSPRLLPKPGKSFHNAIKPLPFLWFLFYFSILKLVI